MADRVLRRPLRSKKNQSPNEPARAGTHRNLVVGAPRVPTRETVASAPGGSGWIPVPFRDARSTRVFVEMRPTPIAVWAVQHRENSNKTWHATPRTTTTVTSYLWPTSLTVRWLYQPTF